MAHRRRALDSLRRCLIAVAAIALLAPAVPAVAQGTDGAVADPISSRDLTAYGNRLGLSPQQRLALVAIHDDYRKEYRALRDGQIASFLKETNSFMQKLPGRDRADRLLRDLDQIRGKTRILDERLIDRMAPILTDEQLTALPRIRLHRKRARLGTQQIMSAMMMAGRRPLDLSDILYTVDLDPETRRQLDPMIAAYERTLTRKTEQLHDESMGMFGRMFDIIEAEGFAEADMAAMDPEEMARFGEVMQSAYMGMLRDVGVIAQDMRKDDVKAFERIVNRLDKVPARQFRAGYVEAAHPEARLAVFAASTRWMLDAHESPLLDATQRPLVEATIDGFEKKQLEALRAVMKQADERASRLDTAENMAEGMAEMFAGQSGATEMLKDIQAALAETTVELQTVLGEDLFVRLQRGSEEPTDEAVAGGTPSEDGGGMTVVGDQYVASRMNSKQFRALLDRLELEDQTDVAVLLYDEYAGACINAPETKALQAGMQRIWSMDAEKTITAAQLRTLREEAVAALRRNDDTLFDNLAALITDDAEADLERIRAQRHRQRLNHGRLTSMFGVQGAGTVDLVAIAGELDALPAATDSGSWSALDAYGRAVAPLFAERYTVLLDQAEMNEDWNQLSRNAGADFDWNEYTERMTPISERLTDVVNRIREHNEALLEKLEPLLASDAFTTLRRGYLARAYPEVYNDPAALDTHLSRILELSDLTPEQRDDVMEIAAAYRPEYERLSTLMIALSSEAATFNFENREQWADVQERRRELSRHRYDRNELIARSITKLQATLEPIQIIRIGGLPELPESGNDVFGF